MTRRLHITLACTALLGGTAAAAFARPFGPPKFDLDWHTIDGSGSSTSAGGPAGSELTLSATIGQHDAGPAMTGGPAGNEFALTGGFWTVAADPATPCPADTDGGGEVNVDDLVAVILAWGTDGAGLNADVDGSGIVDVDDLVAVIIAWGPCPD
jgi:hypothetical protein